MAAQVGKLQKVVQEYQEELDRTKSQVPSLMRVRRCPIDGWKQAEY